MRRACEQFFKQDDEIECLVSMTARTNPHTPLVVYVPEHPEKIVHTVKTIHCRVH